MPAKVFCKCRLNELKNCSIISSLWWMIIMWYMYRDSQARWCRYVTADNHFSCAEGICSNGATTRRWSSIARQTNLESFQSEDDFHFFLARAYLFVRFPFWANFYLHQFRFCAVWERKFLETGFFKKWNDHENWYQENWYDHKEIKNSDSLSHEISLTSDLFIFFVLN